MFTFFNMVKFLYIIIDINVATTVFNLCLNTIKIIMILVLSHFRANSSLGGINKSI